MKEVDVSSLEYQLALPIPCGVCAEIQADGGLRKDKRGHRDHTAEVVPASGYGRPQQESDQGVHTEPVGGGQNIRPN